jgi:hypothetical protein
MAQDKAVTNSTADKGIKVSPNRIKSLKGRLKASKTKKPVGRPAIPVDYDKLTEYASQDIINRDIAKALGMSPTLFYMKMREDPKFKKAYEQGMENRKFELERALYRRAAGYQTEEKKTVVTNDPEKGQIIQTTVTEKSYVPDTTALIFTLSNVMPDKYKQKGPESKLDININVNQINQLSDDELVKIASGAIIEAEALDYTIE